MATTSFDAPDITPCCAGCAEVYEIASTFVPPNRGMPRNTVGTGAEADCIHKRGIWQANPDHYTGRCIYTGVAPESFIGNMLLESGGISLINAFGRFVLRGTTSLLQMIRAAHQASNARRFLVLRRGKPALAVHTASNGTVYAAVTSTVRVRRGSVNLATLGAPPYNTEARVLKAGRHLDRGRPLMLERPPTLQEVDHLAHQWGSSGQPVEIAVTAYRHRDHGRLTWAIYKGDSSKAGFPREEMLVWHYHPRTALDTDEILATPSMEDLLVYFEQQNDTVRRMLGDRLANLGYRPGLLWRDASGDLMYTSYNGHIRPLTP